MTLTEALLARGYTHRPPTDEDRRAHRPASIYARAILDATGECVAVLAAHEGWEWLDARGAC